MNRMIEFIKQTMSVITQSSFHNTHKVMISIDGSNEQKSQKVSWDIADDSSNDDSYSDS